MLYWTIKVFITGFGTPCLNFHIVFMHMTSHDVDLMNSLSLENVLSVANSEKESAFESWVKLQSSSRNVPQNFYSPCGR